MRRHKRRYGVRLILFILWRAHLYAAGLCFFFFGMEHGGNRRDLGDASGGCVGLMSRRNHDVQRRYWRENRKRYTVIQPLLSDRKGSQPLDLRGDA